MTTGGQGTAAETVAEAVAQTAAETVAQTAADIRAGDGRGVTMRQTTRHEELTSSEFGIWLASRRHPEAYNIHRVWEIDGSLDEEALRAAVAEVVGRHRVFGRRLHEGADGPSWSAGRPYRSGRPTKERRTRPSGAPNRAPTASTSRPSAPYGPGCCDGLRGGTCSPS